jgi:hypothetical protein
MKSVREEVIQGTKRNILRAENYTPRERKEVVGGKNWYTLQSVNCSM